MTSIPISQIDLMERAALQDLHHSVHLSLPCWLDHVSKLLSTFTYKGALDELDVTMIPILDEMETEARQSLVRDAKDRLSGFQTSVAWMKQYLREDWDISSRALTYEEYSALEKRFQHELKARMVISSRNVSELVDDTDPEEEEEEFLDYDGAERFLPTRSEIRQLRSRSSGDTLEASHNTDCARSAVDLAAQQQGMERPIVMPLLDRDHQGTQDERFDSQVGHPEPAVDLAAQQQGTEHPSVMPLLDRDHQGSQPERSDSQAGNPDFPGMPFYGPDPMKCLRCRRRRGRGRLPAPPLNDIQPQSAHSIPTDRIDQDETHVPLMNLPLCQSRPLLVLPP